MNKIFLKALLAVTLYLSVGKSVFAVDCATCGQKDLPDLAMLCPKCQTLLHTPQSRVKACSTAALVVEVIYTGDNPDKLPEYAKVFLNRKLLGNIPIIDKESRKPVKLDTGRKGLGEEFTAIYRNEFRDLFIGTVKIQIEMRFKKLYGILKNVRRVEFPFVELKQGEITTLKHTFNDPRKFQNKDQHPNSPSNKFPIKFECATGSIGIEVPLMK